MTTHSLEEADALSDRIAIMSHGKIEDIGTSLELKERHGPGYKLHCVKTSKSTEFDASLEAVVKDSVSGGYMDKDQSSGAEISFVLPTSEVGFFPALFDRLEVEAGNLGLASFGLTPSTLEDVFLKLDKEQQTKVTVSSEGNEPFEVPIEMSETIDTLKERIAPILELEVNRMELKFGQTLLEDGTITLEDYKIENASTVALVIKDATDAKVVAIGINDENNYERRLLSQFKAVSIRT